MTRLTPLARAVARHPLAALLLATTWAAPSGLTAQGAAADSTLVRALVARNIGPVSMSGRIIDIAVAEAPRAVRGGRLGATMYVAVATGGIWKTTNGGLNWSPITDGIGVGSIGAVAAAPSDGNVVWVGSGESNNMRSSSWGIGVFKSTDGGRTWSQPMLPKSQHIGRIVIDPRDPNVVYVAANGPLWGPGGERGLYKTTDGGKTWTNTKSLSEFTGFTEVVMDPANPDVLYAASQQRERRAYGFLPAGPEAAIWKTTDGAKTWTKLASGLPTGDLGRIGLSVCRSRPNTVYALIHAKAAANGLYRTDDAGSTWRQVNNSNGTAWFYGQVRCDPTDAEHVIKLNVGSTESYDGGRTWRPYAQGGGVHADHHALWINPEDGDHQVMGNDGGLDITQDRGRTWYNVENIVGAQFYAISTDDRWPFYHVYGGLQDNQTWGGPNRTRNAFGPTNADWYRMAGGDGFFNVTDRFDPDIVYAESQNGGIQRYNARTGQLKGIKPPAGSGEKHRYNWSAPIVPSRHTKGTVYFAANHLFKSQDMGDSWKTVSPDLTRNLDRDQLPMRGSAPAKDALGVHEGTAAFGNISAVSESPRRAGVLAVGTDDGVVQTTRDDGRTWHKSTAFPGVPDTTYVSGVQLSRHAEGTVYASFDGHRSNDFKPYVARSTDYGRTWTNISGNLPPMATVQAVREHHRQPNLLFVGTEFGVFFTVDGGTTWTPLKGGMPTVPVWDLQIQERWNDLVIGTHGRGVYIVDDLSPLEHLAEAKRASVAYLFPARNELVYAPNTSRNSGMGSTGYTGQNPEHGVRLAYLLNGVQASDSAKLEIVDGRGRVIRELPVTSRAGLYRPVWDMRVGAPLTGDVPRGGAPAAGGPGGGGGFGGFNRGAPTYLAAPGNYTARLTVKPASGAATVVTSKFTLLPDPEQQMAQGALESLDAFRLDVVRFQKSVTAAQSRADSVIRRYAAARKAVEGAKDKITPALNEQFSAIERDLNAFVREVGASAASRTALAPRAGAVQAEDGEEEENRGSSGAPDMSFNGRAGTLNGVLNSTFPVAGAQRSLLTQLRKQLADEEAKLAKISTGSLPTFIKSLETVGVTVSQ
ncbi:MAG: glycosyl hydrolase [Gemmatimonadaceae bacterium]|nr:glycosyl hydrolase [Gemmatimonadaceae bacterium]